MKPRSVTFRTPVLLKVLKTGVGITPHFDYFNEEPPEGREYVAIWDTGATTSVVTEKVAKECGLTPSGRRTVVTANGERDCNVYQIGILLPNQVGIAGIAAIEAEIGGDVDVLIGMDVISLGDFAITAKDGKTVFSFQYPSVAEIDFVKNPQGLKIPRWAKRRGGKKRN